jgi:hypothetical protein
MNNIFSEIQVQIEEKISASLSNNEADDCYTFLYKLTDVLSTHLKSGQLFNAATDVVGVYKDSIKKLELNLEESRKLPESIKQLEEKEKELINHLERENYTQKLKDKLELESKIFELNGIKEAIIKLDTNALKNEITQLESDNQQEFSQFLALIDQAIKQLETIDGLFNTNESLKNLKRNSIKIKEQEELVLSTLGGDLDTLFNNYSENFQTLATKKTEYNILVGKLKAIQAELKEINETHPKNVAIWKAHFEANTNIWGGLNERDRIKVHIENLRKQIEESLTEFDKKIIAIVQANDSLAFYEYHQITFLNNNYYGIQFRPK